MRYKDGEKRKKKNALQIKIYEPMISEEKIKKPLRLYYSAKQLKSAASHQDHSKWTEKEIQEKVL
jgi:hypothetical protein